MRFALALLGLLWFGSAHAQTPPPNAFPGSNTYCASGGVWVPCGGSSSSGGSSGNPIYVAPSSVAAPECQGGTGSVIATVATTATEVCAAATTTRTWFGLTNGNAPGGNNVYCTFDGTTPTLTHWNFPLYANGAYDSGGMQNVPPGIISCIAANASTTITAAAVQTGAP